MRQPSLDTRIPGTNSTPYNQPRHGTGKRTLNTIETLLRNSLWGQALSADAFQRALAGTVERRFPANAFICMKGEPVTHWMGIIDGLGKMASHWTSGKTTSLTGISTGGWFGEGSLLKEEPRRYDVMAIRETRVAFMNRATFLWLLDHSIPFNRYMITQLNERLGQFIGMMENERMLGIDTRTRPRAGCPVQPGVVPRHPAPAANLAGRARVSRRGLPSAGQPGDQGVGRSRAGAL